MTYQRPLGLSDEEWAEHYRAMKKARAHEHYERNKEKVKARAAAWKAANPEKKRESNRRTMAQRRATDAELRERERQHRKKDWAENKEKRHAKYKEWVAKHRDYHNAWHRAKRREFPQRYLLRLAKLRAKEFSLPFSLTTDDIVIPTHCPVLGMELHVAGGQGAGPNSPSVDRVIPELGYVPENIRVISHRANRLKDNATPEELEAVVKYMREEIARVRAALLPP